jgi:hypothetical protein
MSATPQFIFNQTLFTQLFPEFAAEQYASALPSYWNMACSYIQNQNSFPLNNDDLLLALQQMTAHIAKVYALIAAGQVAVPVTGAAQGSVNLSAMPPPAKNGWQWWLATTEYGKMLWPLLQNNAAGGFYVGGTPERSAFRRVGGGFW